MSGSLVKSNHSILNLTLIGIAVCIPSFLASVDGFIVSSAISAISGQLGVRRETGLWIITLYNISHIASIPVAALMGTIFGKRRSFLFGLGLFIIASAAAGFSQTFNFLLAMRVVQGIGAGFIIPLAVAIIVSHFPMENRGTAIGFWSLCVFVSPSMGPWIGGMLSNHLWHLMFLSNLPLALLCFLLATIVLEDEPCHKERWGHECCAIGILWVTLGALQAFVDRGQLYDWFRSKVIIALCVTTIIGFVSFFIWERFQTKRLFPYEYFKKRSFTSATIIQSVSMALFFSSFTLEAFWVQEVLAYPPIWAGYVMLPLGIIPPLLYPFVGQYIRRYGGQGFVIFSLLIFAGTFFCMSRINMQSTFGFLALNRFVQGLAFPFITVSNAVTAYASATDEELPMHIGIYSFSRNLLVGLGVALSSTLWIHRTTFYTTRLASRSHATAERFLSLYDRILPFASSKHQAIGLVNEQLVYQAKTLGLADIYYLFAWIYLALIVFVFFGKTQKSH